jgi:Skp family chaperone for outer membrane proteins
MEIAYAKYNSIFEEYLGKLDDWKNNLTSVFSNRQAMLDKIEENIANGKIKAQVELLP